jgi:agmatinase
MKTYAGIPEENASLENSKVMLVTVPYDGTSTWGKGADKGPELFLMLLKTWSFMTLKRRQNLI